MQKFKLNFVSNIKERYKKNRNFKKYTNFVVISLFVVFGIWLTGYSLAKNNDTSSSTVSSTQDCSPRVKNYNYQVPFGNAVWNQPVCNIERYSKSDEYVARLLQWGTLSTQPLSSEPANSNHTYISVKPSFPGSPTLFDPEGLAGLFDQEVYYTSEATTRTKIQASVYNSNLDGKDIPYGDLRNNLPESTIPWNPKWRTGEGGDNAIVILDDTPGPTEGRMYKISGYKRDFAAISQCGPLFRDERICTYTTSVARDLEGNYIDYRSYEGFLDQRGVGLSALAGMITPEEVKAGEIRHALGLVIPNTAIGPPCTDAEKGTSAEGFQCGVAFAPASKHEWSSARDISHANSNPQLVATYTLDKTIPEGIRYALDVSYEDIEAWLNSRADFTNNPRLKDTARIFAIALKNYGMMVVDTNGSRPGLQTMGGVNPKSAKLWKELGLGPEQPGTLLKGLLNSDNLYVVDPPTVTCVDGKKSKYSCKWSKAEYDKKASTQTSISPSSVNQPPIISIVNLPAVNLTEPASLDITTESNDPDGKISKIELISNGIVINKQTPSSSITKWRWDKIPAGKYTISAKATDEKGATTDSEPVSIIVESTNPNISKPNSEYTPDEPSDTQNSPDSISNTLVKPTKVILPSKFPVNIGWNTKLFEFHQAANISWSASSSPVGIKKYSVKKNGKVIYEGSARKFDDFAIDSGQRYKYEITAIDTKGNSSKAAVFEGKLSCSWFGWSCSF